MIVQRLSNLKEALDYFINEVQRNKASFLDEIWSHVCGRVIATNYSSLSANNQYHYYVFFKKQPFNTFGLKFDKDGPDELVGQSVSNSILERIIKDPIDTFPILVFIDPDGKCEYIFAKNYHLYVKENKTRWFAKDDLYKTDEFASIPHRLLVARDLYP